MSQHKFKDVITGQLGVRIVTKLADDVYLVRAKNGNEYQQFKRFLVRK